MPTIAAYAYRHSIGRPYIYPDNDLSFTGNFLNMLFRMTELKYQVNPVLERALDVLFILHADHEQNCSTSAMRGIGSSHVDPVFGDGRRGGGALRTAARRRQRSGAAHAHRDRHACRTCPGFIKRVKAGEGRLMGFGHRVYKSYDPRAKIIKRTADQVFEVTGRNPLLDIALELERIALEDEYFVSRQLYPNVDFYSGLIYQAMGFPVTMFPVLFAIPRTSGWIAQWEEMLLDPSRRSRGRVRSISAPRGGTTCLSVSEDSGAARVGALIDASSVACRCEPSIACRCDGPFACRCDRLHLRRGDVLSCHCELHSSPAR